VIRVRDSGLQFVHPLADQVAIQRSAVPNIELTERVQHVIAQVALIVMPSPLVDAGERAHIPQGMVTKQHRSLR
jgi:hypothetical protein